MIVSNSRQHNESAAGVRSGLFYLLVGGGIGATIALLFAPKKGADLRSDISDLTRKGYDETLALAGQIKGQSAGLYDSIKEKADKALNLAALTFDKAQETIGESANDAANLINGEIKPGTEKILQKNAGTGRRPSSIF